MNGSVMSNSANDKRRGRGDTQLTRECASDLQGRVHMCLVWTGLGSRRPDRRHLPPSRGYAQTFPPPRILSRDKAFTCGNPTSAPNGEHTGRLPRHGQAHNGVFPAAIVA